MTATADVLANIREQLDWRGPSGKCMGHIVLTRERAELVKLVLESWLASEK